MVYVIDRSISMGPSEGLSRAKFELVASLAALPPEVRFQVVLYNESAEPLLLYGENEAELLPASPEPVRDACDVILRVCASGTRTDHVRGLIRGLRFNPAVLFLVTDGDGLTPARLREVKRANRRPTVIHVVHVGFGAGGRAALERLAHENGGVYLRPGQPDTSGNHPPGE